MFIRSLHGTLGFIKSYQSVKFLEQLLCFTFRIILWFYAILRVFVLYSHYGHSISNEELNGHQALESLGPLRSSLLFREPPASVFQLYFHLLKFLKALPLYMLLLSSISDKDVLFIFSANKAAAEEVP